MNILLNIPPIMLIYHSFPFNFTPFVFDMRQLCGKYACCLGRVMLVVERTNECGRFASISLVLRDMDFLVCPIDFRNSLAVM